MPLSKLALDIFSRLNRHDFATFTFEALRTEYHDLGKIYDADDIYYRRSRFDVPHPDSYCTTEHAVYINHFNPIELFQQPTGAIDEVQLSNALEKLKHPSALFAGHESKDITEMYLLQNTAEPEAAIWGLAENVSAEFKKLVQQAGFTAKTFGVGTFSSFMSYRPEETTQALARLVLQPSDGLAVAVQDGKTEVRPFWSEKPLFCGVASDSVCPYEPVYILAKRQDAAIFEELKLLLNLAGDESELERFFVTHYRDFLGPHYNQIEAQIWLRFPELDIAGRERRLDVFVRNSIERDWELFELKRAIPRITKDNDLPMFISKVHDAIAQLKNYGELLRTKAVKDRFAKEGIKYFEPSLNLVIGRRPQIDYEQWRRLLYHNSGRIRLYTWDDILEKLKSCHETREQMLKLAASPLVNKLGNKN